MDISTRLCQQVRVFHHTPLFYRKEPMMRHFPSDTIMPRTYLYQIVSSNTLHRAAEQGECGIPVTALLRACRRSAASEFNIQRLEGSPPRGCRAGTCTAGTGRCRCPAAAAPCCPCASARVCVGKEPNSGSDLQLRCTVWAPGSWLQYKGISTCITEILRKLVSLHVCHCIPLQGYTWSGVAWQRVQGEHAGQCVVCDGVKSAYALV